LKLIQHMLLDKGYDYMDVYNLIEAEHYEGHVAQRTNSPMPQRKRKAGRKKARRWVVERTHGWMNRFRRVLTRWETTASICGWHP
jgi:transposase